MQGVSHTTLSWYPPTFAQHPLASGGKEGERIRRGRGKGTERRREGKGPPRVGWHPPFSKSWKIPCINAHISAMHRWNQLMNKTTQSSSRIIVPEWDARWLWWRWGLDSETRWVRDESVVDTDAVDPDMVESSRITLVYNTALLWRRQSYLAQLPHSITWQDISICFSL